MLINTMTDKSTFTTKTRMTVAATTSSRHLTLKMKSKNKSQTIIKAYSQCCLIHLTNQSFNLKITHPTKNQNKKTTKNQIFKKS
jgi:hypothetical protein